MNYLLFLLDFIYSSFSYLLSYFIPPSPFKIDDKNGVPTVAVIGSGFSGLCAAIQLKKNFGIKAQVFEASPEIGGTWEANTYPGCACDIPSHLYSFSFDLKPDWTRSYSPQKEILNYLKDVANKYEIYNHTYLNTQVIKATWLEEQKKWRVDYRNKKRPEEIKSAYYNIVFGGLGPLRIPNYPEQFKSFEGTIVHTAVWNPKINFKGKNVAVIGTGASAVQVIPELRKVASKVICYQRSPAWVVARSQYDYSQWVKTLFTWCPPAMKLFRIFLFLRQEIRFPLMFKDRASSLAQFIRKAMIKEMSGRLTKEGREDLIPKLIPEYPVGCKRVCISEIYLESLSQNNVEIKTSKITEVKGQSIRLEDGTEDKIDILVLATGFDVEGFLGNLQIYGRDNLCLNDHWNENYPATFQAVNIHGFPNFFLLLGPNTGLGHNSIILMIEIQVKYAMESIKFMLKNKLKAMEAKKSAQDEFVARIREELKTTAWAGSCNSYYKSNKNGPFALWSGTVSYFWWRMRHGDYPRDFIHYK